MWLSLVIVYTIRNSSVVLITLLLLIVSWTTTTHITKSNELNLHSLPKVAWASTHTNIGVMFFCVQNQLWGRCPVQVTLKEWVIHTHQIYMLYTKCLLLGPKANLFKCSEFCSVPRNNFNFLGTLFRSEEICSIPALCVYKHSVWKSSVSGA